MASKQQKQTLKVNVNITVEIDTELYSSEYGIVGADQIRNDIRYAILSQITSGGVVAVGVVGADLAPAQR